MTPSPNSIARFSVRDSDEPSSIPHGVWTTPLLWLVDSSFFPFESSVTYDGALILRAPVSARYRISRLATLQELDQVTIAISDLARGKQTQFKGRSGQAFAQQVLNLNAGDDVRVEILQDSGESKLSGYSSGNFLEFEYLGL